MKMHAVRNERGTAVIETPFAIGIIFLLAMGAITIVQLTWTHLDLSSSVRTATRYATRVDYDPTSTGIGRHRDEDQVRVWTVEVANEAGVDPANVTIAGKHLPSGEAAPIDELVAGDEITITVHKTVSNPLYRVAASISNAASNVFGAGDVFDPDGVDVQAGAVSFVE